MQARVVATGVDQLRVPADLVVLSACDVGTAATRADDPLGLPVALLHAGVRAVIAPVSRVADDVARRFSRALHAGLLAAAPLIQAITNTVVQQFSANVLLAAGAIGVLAVPEEAIQTFRDWQVVFVRYGDWFEARPLELGRTDNGWVEVLSGLKPGERYAATNSYAIKAEIGKLGATHDH